MDGWYYYKLSDGFCLLFKNVSIGPVNIDQSFGSGYYRSTSISFPSGLLVAAPIITLQPFNGGELLSCSLHGVSKDTCSFYLFNTRTITGQNPTIHVHAYGRWK